MSLPKFAIENHQFSMIVVTILVLLGIVSFLTMPRSENPQISPAGTTIFAVYPGANPTDVEKLIIKPIEDELNELEDIKELKSTARNSFGKIDIEFLSGSDGDEKYSDVIQKVNSIRNNLPAEIISVDMIKWTITDVKILQVALVSDTTPYKELEKEAEVLQDELKNISGVKKVEIWGFPEQEIRITPNFEKMAQQNISLSHLIGALQNSNLNIPGGKLDISGKDFGINTSGNFESLEEIENTIINFGSNQLVYVKDIATVEYTYEDQNYYARYNGKRSVYVTVTQKNGTNVFSIMEQLKAKIEKYQNNLTPRIKLETIFDQSIDVSNRLDGFFLNLLQGLFLVGLIVILAVGFRESLIVLTVIPISIIIGIGLIDLSGYGLQQMTIAGLVVALGLLVDNAIVVTENISRFINLGYSKLEAAIKGSSQIALAVTSSTATTVLAFVPMMLMADVTGDFIRSMPIIVSFTLIASLWISLTVTPYLAKKFYNDSSIKHESKTRSLLNRFVKNKYSNRLDFALSHPKKVIVSSILIFILSLVLFPLVGVSFFPKAEKPQFIININLPEGSSIDKTDNVARFVEEVLATKEEVSSFASNVGRGNPRIYYNVLSKRNAANHAQFFVQLHEYEYSKFNEFLNDLRSEFDLYPGAQIDVKDFQQGPPVEAPIAIKVLGDNINKLKELSQKVEKEFKSTEGTLNVNNPLGTSKTDLHININRAKASMYGVQIAEIDKAVRANIAGLTISKFRDDEGKEYNIIIRGEELETNKIQVFDKIYVS